MAAKKGFTLIELVMVIVIIGILAAVALPKFVSFKSKAILKSEDAIIAAMNTALKIYYTSYIVAGGDPITYPNVNPFTLLQQAPPYALGPVPIVPDGVTWRYYNHQPGYMWGISCPHRDGDPTAMGGCTRGRLWNYVYQDNYGHKAGDLYEVSSIGY